MLKNNHGIADADEVFDAGGVPVRQPNATVTRGPANCFRIVRAVNADTWFVQPHPEHADEVVRAGRKIVIVLSPHTVVEHAFVVAEPRPNGHAENFPCANGRG